MRKYWLCVTTYNNYDTTLRENVWGVRKRFEKKLKMIKKGNWIVFYVIGKKLGGIFEVMSGIFFEDTNIFVGGKFPYRIRLKGVLAPKIPVDWSNEIVYNLKFIKDKSKWKHYLHGRTIVPVSANEMEYLKKYIAARGKPTFQ